LPAGISRFWLRRILLANLIGQVLIVLSGGVVRLTGSGLGCPTFPECVPGSYIPVVTQPQGVHKYIEFGNRMLTFVLTLLAVAALLAVVRYVRTRAEGEGRGNQHPSSRVLLVLGAVPFLGVLTQALIGGISVLTKLNPTVVAIHFLVSMSLIAGSTLLLLVALPPQASDQPPVDQQPVGRAPGQWRPSGLIRALTVTLAIVTVPLLALGTTVTGSGPHSGDANDPNRFGFNIAVVAHLHADAVWLFVAVLITLIVALRRTGAPAFLQTRAAALVLVTLAQGVIGYVQYALGVPIALVALHMLGAALLVVATTTLGYGVLSRARSADFAPAPVEATSLRPVT
jgi:cytochrome c oxidase assembly protein subunit 15